MDLKSKMITLDNNEKYVVVDVMNYANRQFILLDKIIGEASLEENFEIAEFSNNQVKFINDEELKKELNILFKQR